MPEMDDEQRREIKEFRRHRWRQASMTVLVTVLVILLALIGGVFVLTGSLSVFKDTPSSPATGPRQ